MKTKIIYEDAHILVCYKPAGLATQTARVGQQDMVSELKNYLASTPRRDSYLGIVHRLDQPVEGLLVFAKDSKTAAKLTASLSEGTLNKHYFAVVCGQPDEDSAVLVDYLWKDAANQKAICLGNGAEEEMHPDAKKAVLQYRVLERQTVEEEQLTLLDVHIDTGRFHQIRAQLSHAGLPIIGDGRYADEHILNFGRKLGVRNVALCAYEVVFRHPVTGKKMEYRIHPQGQIFRCFGNYREE